MKVGRTVLILAALAAVAVVGGVSRDAGAAYDAAAAATPVEMNFACALKSNGLMRYVTNLNQCKKTEEKVTIKPGPITVCVNPDGTVRKIPPYQCTKPGVVLTLPPASGTVYFCVSNSTSLLRYVTSPSQCTASEFPVMVTPNAGKIIVKKVTDPSSDTTSFSFTAGGGLSPSSFNLKNGEQQTFSDVVPGSYSVSETVPSGWDLTKSCSDGSDPSSIGVSAGETVTCTFTNTKRGTIIVKKVTDPSSDTTSFSFTAGGGLSPSSFNLKNGEQQTFSDVVPGSYNVTESVPLGWDLTSSTCDDGSSFTNIVVGAGETVTCTFADPQRQAIIVKKGTNPSPDPSDTSFPFTAGGGLSPSSFNLKNGQQQTYSNVLPGSSYSVSETVPSGWVLTSSTCDDGSSVSNIGVGAGDTHTYSLENTGCGGGPFADNSSFQIGTGVDSDKLQSAASFDFETKNSYTICVRSTDAGGLFFDKTFIISVTNVNEAPTEIQLSNNDIDENQPSATPIGNLTATDPDAGQTHTFTFSTSCTGGPFDNSSFQISGNSLQSAVSFNYEVKNSYTICVRATASGSPPLSLDESFNITINDVNDPPVATADGSYNGVIGNTLAVLSTTGSGPHVVLTGNVLTANDTDEDATFPHTVSAVAATVTSTGGGTATINTDGSFTFLPGVGDKNQNDTFTYHATDGSATSAGTVTIGIANFLVWYVDNASAATTHDGRSPSPFLNLASLNGAGGSGDSDGTGDYIFLYQGSGSYGGGIPLEANQNLWGEPHGLTVNGNNLVAAGGSNPVVTNASGTGVGLASGVDVQGLNISGTSGDAINGVSVTTATVGTTNAVNISSAGGDGVDLSGAAGGNISIASPITGSAGHSVSVAGRNSGTVAFSGAISDSGTGISLSGNTGATINLTGGVTLNSGAAFSATGGGTVNVTGSNNTIGATTAGTGPAINVANTTIGSSGLNFKKVSSTSGANGIVLNGTGASGSLVVAGNGNSTVGGDNSGGTIQNTTGHGIALTSTLSPSLTNMNIQNTSGSGINGTQVSGFTFANGTINNSGTGGAADDSNISFNDSTSNPNVTGAVSVTNSVLTNSRYHGVDIQNSTGTISNATVTGNTFTSSTSVASSLGSAVRLVALGSASDVANVTKANLDNNVISNFPSGAGFVVQGGNAFDGAGAPAGTMGQAGNGTNIISIDGNRMDGGLGGVGNQPDRFVTAAVNGRGQGNFDISNNGTAANPITHIDGVVIELSEFGDSTVTSIANNNRIVANNAVASSGIGIGCDSDSLTTTADTGTLTSTINGNNVSLTDGPGTRRSASTSPGTRPPAARTRQPRPHRRGSTCASRGPFPPPTRSRSTAWRRRPRRASRTTSTA